MASRTTTHVSDHTTGSLSSPPLFEEIASRLIDNGYQPIPIRPGTKIPSVPRWQIPKSPAHYMKIRGCARHSVGLLTTYTPAIDIDVRHEKLVQELILLADEGFGRNSPIRIGSPPKTLLMFQSDNPFPKMVLPAFVLPGDNWDDIKYKAHRIEILGNGQMFVSYAKHPGTGKPYQWYRGEPLSIPHKNLPEIAENSAEEFLKRAWETCLGAGALPVRLRSGVWVAASLPEIEKEPSNKGAGWWLGVSVENLKGPLGLKKSGAGWACRCPNHMGEHDNSLNLRQGDDGKLLIHCYGGCEPWEVIEAVGELLEGQLEQIS